MIYIMNHALIAEARSSLSAMLGAELAEIITAISANPDENSNDYFISLPERYTVDLDVGELMGMVARSANSYHRIARLCGMAKAEHTIAEGRYKNRYKSNRVGKSDAERDMNASAATTEELENLLVIEAIYNMAEKLESIARIKSESSRKILDKVQAMQIASSREDRGDINATSFSPY